MLYANANVTGLSYSQVTIENSISYIDENGIGDDRILVAANTPSSSLKGEVRDVLVRNVQVQIASTVTSGLVNGVKFDAGVNSYLHDWETDGILYQNESSTTLGAPINVYTGGNSNQENFNIKNIWATNISTSLIQCARLNSDPTYRFENLKLLNNNSTVGALMIYLATGPSGDEVFTFKNCVMNGTLPGGSSTTYGPVGILLTGSATTGASGNVVIDNCFIDGFNTPISSIVNENGTEQTSGWTNIRVERSKWINCSRNPMFSNTYKLSDNPGFNPTGPQTAPTVPASGTALTNPFPFDSNVYVSGGTVTAIDLGGLAAPTGLALSTATTGGTLAASTAYSYQVTALNAVGQTLASALVSLTTGSTTSTNTITATWNPVYGATSYSIYGRVSGSIAEIANVTTTSYTDTGSVTPSGALPTENTTGAVGTGLTSGGIFLPASETITLWYDNGAANPTLSTALTEGTAYTSLAVTAIPVALAVGDTVTLVSGTNQQTFTLTVAAAASATSLTVLSTIANFSYPTTTIVENSQWGAVPTWVWIGN